MNKKISSLIVTALIVSVISVSVYVQTVKAEGPEPEWFETQTVHSEANSRVPTLAVTANGTWLYAYWDRDGSDYDISLSTSYDNGSSWSYDRTWVTDIPGGHPDGSHLDDPYFFVDDLRSRVYFFLVEKHPTPWHENFIYYRYSDDNGSSWSSWVNISHLKPQSVIDTTKHAQIAMGGTLTSNGTILIAMYGATAEDTAHAFPFAIRSFDGDTFYLASDLFSEASGEDGNENSLALCSNGSILCLARNGSFAGGFSKYYSENDGVNWSYVGQDFPGIGGCRASLLTYTTTEHTDKYRILFSFTNSPVRDDVSCTISYDDGTSWTYTRQIHNGGASPDGSYSLLTKSSNYSILCSYEANGYVNVKLAQFNLEWLTSGNDWVIINQEDPLQFISIDGATNGTTIYDSTPTINWTLVASTSQYWLQIDNNADFSSPEINITNISEINYPTYYDANSTRVSFVLPITLPSYDIYYMRVKALTIN